MNGRVLRNKKERLQIVIDITRQLHAMGLYNSAFPAITQIKRVMNEWIQQDDTQPQQLHSLSGKISFPEMHKKIEYLFPIKKMNRPLFVLKSE